MNYTAYVPLCIYYEKERKEKSVLAQRKPAKYIRTGGLALPYEDIPGVIYGGCWLTYFMIWLRYCLVYEKKYAVRICSWKTLPTAPDSIGYRWL